MRVFRSTLALLTVTVLALSLATGTSAAQSDERHGPPPRLTRPAPQLTERAQFRPNLGETLRLQALGMSLEDLAQRERKRFVPAALQLAFACGFGTAAVFVHDPSLQAAFSLSAAILGARSIVRFSMRAKVPAIIADFSAVPPVDRANVLRKLRIGELGLAHAARVGRRQRIIDGTIGAFGTVAYLPLTYILARNQNSSYRFGNSSGDYVGLSLALIGLAASLVQTLRKSLPEQHYDAYRKLRRATQSLPQVSF